VLRNPIILLVLIGIGWAIYDARKRHWGRGTKEKEVGAAVQPEAVVAERQQAMAKKALRDAAISAAQNSLRIGAISKAQAQLIEAHMKDNPSLRNILDELIATLESNGESEHSLAVKEVDAQLFKGCVSAAE
jgi:hypothetical protein